MMKFKNWVILFLLIIGLAGCNAFESNSNKNSSEACKFEVSQALDQGEYDRAIELLNGTCRDAFTPEERNMNLGAAYLGKAGYDIPSLVNDILESKDESTDPFAEFISRASQKGDAGKAIKYLDKAKYYYIQALKAAGFTDCNSTKINAISDPSERSLIKDICLFKGISQVSQSATSFNLLLKTTNETTSIEDVVEAWSTGEIENACQDVDNNDVVDAAQFASCALEYATKGSSSSCNSVFLTNGTFGHNGKNFEVVKLQIQSSVPGCDNKTDYKVLEISNGSKILVLTDGFCNINNGTKCNGTNENTGCFPCPIVSDSENKTYTVVDTIVETINNGTEEISDIISNVSGTNNETDIEEAVNEFKKDLCEAHPEACLCDGSNCTNSTLDTASQITIKTDNDTLVQNLISDYLITRND